MTTTATTTSPSGNSTRTRFTTSGATFYMRMQRNVFICHTSEWEIVLLWKIHGDSIFHKRKISVPWGKRVSQRPTRPFTLLVIVAKMPRAMIYQTRRRWIFVDNAPEPFEPEVYGRVLATKLPKLRYTAFCLEREGDANLVRGYLEFVLAHPLERLKRDAPNVEFRQTDRNRPENFLCLSQKCEHEICKEVELLSSVYHHDGQWEMPSDDDDDDSSNESSVVVKTRKRPREEEKEDNDDVEGGEVDSLTDEAIVQNSLLLLSSPPSPPLSPPPAKRARQDGGPLSFRLGGNEHVVIYHVLVLEHCLLRSPTSKRVDIVHAKPFRTHLGAIEFMHEATLTMIKRFLCKRRAWHSADETIYFVDRPPAGDDDSPVDPVIRETEREMGDIRLNVDFNEAKIEEDFGLLRDRMNNDCPSALGHRYEWKIIKTELGFK